MIREINLYLMSHKLTYKRTCITSNPDDIKGKNSTIDIHHRKCYTNKRFDKENI